MRGQVAHAFYMGGIVLKLKIYSPNGLMFEKDVTVVTVRTVEGEMGLLERRAPIIAKLKVDKVVAKDNTQTYEYVIDDGFLHCDGENVIIVTEDIKKEIDPHKYLGG